MSSRAIAKNQDSSLSLRILTGITNHEKRKLLPVIASEARLSLPLSPV